MRVFGEPRPGGTRPTVMSRPSTDLMTEYFPKTQIRTPLEGTQALCSTDKARRLLGWEPQHTWRDHLSA